jgi:hypothetical protein
MDAQISQNYWIPLMDYAMKKGVSLSTLRRYIKANKIQYRVENGRYLLLDGETNRPMDFSTPLNRGSGAVSDRWQQEIAPSPLAEDLMLQLQKAQEEIVELKTLIAFYEESSSAN